MHVLSTQRWPSRFAKSAAAARELDGDELGCKSVLLSVFWSRAESRYYMYGTIRRKEETDR
jgi:hypothetical protein